MPFGDRTGPRGLGPMTGRGLGQCGNAWPGGRYGGYWRGAGSGLGRGGGRGHGRRAAMLPGRFMAGRSRMGGLRYSYWSPEEELDYLKDYALGLEEALTAARARMADLGKDEKTE